MANHSKCFKVVDQSENGALTGERRERRENTLYK